MKILHLSTNDLHGGAAKAAYRLHKELIKCDIESIMLVQNKQSGDKNVIGPKNKFRKFLNLMRPTIDRILLKLTNKNCREQRSLNILPSITYKKIKEINPDIIHIHWIGGGFIPIEEIRKYDKPIVWTLHDMWAFSGAEHILSNKGCYKHGYFSKECKKTNRCLLDKFIWYRKKRSWKKLDIQFVAPSDWMLLCVQNSFFSNKKNLLIHHGVDTDVFKPLEKSIAREILNLPQNKEIILFGAVHPDQEHKGFKYLQESLEHIKKQNVVLCVFGDASENYFDSLEIDFWKIE
ncbi:glycosyltransferase [Poseidonibacter ostreae]|uniref:Glycosyltransferase n=1 Tax=Poseidonibacter ostreae TaxID=2654171 RepID=A0A6L4WQT5_9BACT|nr:glycosyltransferase [Poseidonibacter ostreae]KAB7887408.1 glycosyltransferase [Poseidonibacter ostreae]